MTLNYFKHSDAPIGVTIQTSILWANRTSADETELENAALAQEALGKSVWTEDIAGNAIVPRGKRPVS